MLEQEKRIKIYQLYAQGEKEEQIEQILGVSRKDIRDVKSLMRTEIIKLLQEGQSIEQVSFKLGINPKIINSLTQSRLIKAQEAKQTAEDLYKKGISTKEIASKLNVAIATVDAYIRDIRNSTSQRVSELIYKGYSPEQIQKMINRPMDEVKRFIKETEKRSNDVRLELVDMSKNIEDKLRKRQLTIQDLDMINDFLRKYKIYGVKDWADVRVLAARCYRYIGKEQKARNLIQNRIDKGNLTQRELEILQQFLEKNIAKKKEKEDTHVSENTFNPNTKTQLEEEPLDTESEIIDVEIGDNGNIILKRRIGKEEFIKRMSEDNKEDEICI